MTAGRKVNGLRQDWGTPKKYVDAVKKTFGGIVHLDPCTNQHSIVGAKFEYQLPGQDGLHESWNFPSIFVNPPYGADRKRGTTIKNWLGKCAQANSKFGSEVIALVPVATNTSHWKNYIWGKATAICFLYDTRLRFLIKGKDVGKGAPMACAMIYWGKNFEKFQEIFLEYGAVVDLRPMIGLKIGSSHKLEHPQLFPFIQ